MDGPNTRTPKQGVSVAQARSPTMPQSTALSTETLQKAGEYLET
jgi:hypothetical protein